MFIKGQKHEKKSNMLFIAMVLFLIWNKKKINFTEQF